MYPVVKGHITRIRVLQLVASSRGGGASHVRDLALGLPRDAFDVTVAMPTDGGNVSPADFSAAGIPFEVVNIAEGFAWHEVRRLRQRLQREGFHILHVHGSRAALFGRLAAATMRSRPRVVFSIHGFATPWYSLVKRCTYLALERALQRVTDRTICVAQAEADSFLSHRLASPERIDIVPYGIDVARFAEGPGHTSAPELRGASAPGVRGASALRGELQLGDGLVVLMVCRLNVPRDFGTLLTAFSLVRSEFPGIHLLIVGDGPQRDQIEGLVTRLGLAASVRLTGFRDDVPALMALAHVCVLTSYAWEGFPISTLEAQAAGRPVVVTDAGGSREAVLHERTGLIVPRRSPRLLADALVRLLRDPDLRRRLGEAGRRRARKEFTRERMVERIGRIYEGLVASRWLGSVCCQR